MCYVTQLSFRPHFDRHRKSLLNSSSSFIRMILKFFYFLGKKISYPNRISDNLKGAMSVEFCWTRTADHVRLAEIASHKSSCLAANFNQLQLHDPWAANTSRSGLLICSGQPQPADARYPSSGYDYRSLAFHINSWLDNLPTVNYLKKIMTFIICKFVS